MQVDYLLYHEDYKKIEGMLEGLTDRPDGLFDPRWRGRRHVAWGGNGTRWSDVTLRRLQRVGTHVLEYNVTLPITDPYPAMVAALLIDRGWLVKVRYRNADNGDEWTYMKCEFPEGTEYDLPDDWEERDYS